VRRAKLLCGLAGAALVVATADGPAVTGAGATPAQAQPAAVNGAGSTYVALAMDQWIGEVTALGLDVNYGQGGSPAGLTLFKQRTTDFAGTEAEFDSLGQGTDDSVTRGFQYIPDVAGAVAVMYNVKDKAGRPVDYLRLSRSTVARIFMGYIAYWDDPAITTDLGGQIELPHEPITVTYRSGQSGTTALFYDFVAHTEPGLFADWTARNQLPTAYRIIELPPTFAPSISGKADSVQVADHIANTPWTIGYDEFGYSKLYPGLGVAWIQNQAGAWVKPYAANISAALEAAHLRPNLSQDLTDVYTNPNPGAYPISAYSYMVTQCQPSADAAGALCRGDYPNGGISETLKRFLRHVACDGQQQMAAIGYAPLPKELSQFVADAVARMSGEPVVTLTRENCGNPRFDPTYLLPGGEQPPPLPDPPGVGNLGAGAGGRGTATTGTTGGPSAEAAAGAAAATGRSGATDSVGGGSDDWRVADPVGFTRPGPSPIGRWPLAALAVILALPVLVGVVRDRLRRGH
jgi:phosphate transport system substrate-binding protein